MEKCIFALGMAFIASIAVGLMYGWMSLLNYPATWVHTVFVIEIIALILVCLIEVGASQTAGASGWMMFLFMILNILLGMGLGILKFCSWLLAWF